MIGYVIMPNHLHMITHFSRGSKRGGFMRDFKKFTSTRIRIEIEHHQPDMLKEIRFRRKEQVFKIWMDRYDELYLESKDLLETKLAYIHDNPLQEKWSLATNPEDYPLSSASFYEKQSDSPIPLHHYLEFV